MPKKTATAKRKTKTTAKRGPGRPKGSKNVNKPAAKKSAAKKKTASARGGATREMNPDTGFAVGSDQDTIALALLEGGESRAAVVESLEKSLDTETRNGTPKQVTNMVSGVLNKMLARGYFVESSFILNAPTPASKRAATRAANAKSKAPAKKTAAKKTAAKKTTSKKSGPAKRGPGRPKGSKNKKTSRKK